MVGFLHWIGSIFTGVMNAIVKVVVFVVLLVVVLVVVGMARGDGLPSNMVLNLDLQGRLPDSTMAPTITLAEQPLSMMDVVLALDQAGRDHRVKGVMMRLGNADLSIAQAEELSAALKRFRSKGKYVTAYAQGFNASGLGDYLAASSADEIWMMPKSVFSAAGEGASAMFLRGFFEKFDATPQIVKRSDYKSAADMYMEKGYTPANREQTEALLHSWYDTATAAAAKARKITPAAMTASFEASPQFAGDVKKAGLIDRLGYDDDAEKAALKRAGDDAEKVSFRRYARATGDASEFGPGAHIALIPAAGEIVDGSGGGGLLSDKTVIAGDDYAKALRDATKDKDIKAILLRVDSPGGSVTASAQILDAVKKAQAAGKPVVVSMGSVAASGGYYISASADRIVAEPGTITGSIGVLTGKVAIGKSLGLLGVSADQIGVGKNALFDSAIQPFTDDQLASLNKQADTIYADFVGKVAKGRKLPLSQVQTIAKGRVWSGADAKTHGLVDELGGFWTAVAATKSLAGIKPDAHVVFKRYPREKNFFEAFNETFGSSSASLKAVQGLVAVMNMPGVRTLLKAAAELPRGAVELRATNLPGQ